jgi:putative transposase
MLPFVSLFKWLPRLCLSTLESAFRRWTTPPSPSFVQGTLIDLTRNKAQLIPENAFLHQQLAILHCQVPHPQLNRTDRFWLLVLAGRVANWNQLLRIIQPDTLLRWHREGFRMFWKRKSQSQGAKRKLARETIDLINVSAF